MPNRTQFFYIVCIFQHPKQGTIISLWFGTKETHPHPWKTQLTEKCQLFTTFMLKTHIQQHIFEENKIMGPRQMKAPFWYLCHLGVAHAQICAKYLQSFFTLPKIWDPSPVQLSKLPKQNVKHYLTSLHINEWTLPYILTWPKTSSVHFLFPFMTIKWIFYSVH